jgi:DNA-binding transcriptional MerR regulator
VTRKPAPTAPYSASMAARLAGISYRQIDYWARIGFIRPSVKDATGSGTYRSYSQEDVDKLLLTKRLIDAGVDLTRIVQDRDPRLTLRRLDTALRPLIESEAVPA